ncbi:MAG: hypothetical protein ABI549_11965 [Flavobacterium sp.]|uniref:hypothetical protein n=1 Tax=Flavobacterium sp. TaxID=239 RepID=UPI00326593AD
MKKTVLFLLIIMLSSCKEDKVPLVSFYYWKTQLKLTKLEKQTLNKNEVKKLYVRYFDVKLVNNKAFPVAPIHFLENVKNQEIIPVVFIKNEIFSSKKINHDELVTNILKLINQIDKVNRIQNSEIQIDCDWTIESKDNYMRFLEILKSKYHKIISVTIRLHQIKYSNETKIPSVDYGVLMFYNMGKLGTDNSNSIYDPKIAEKYLPSLKNYPLKLKVALPIFSWIIHSRNNQIVNLISKIELESFKNNANFEFEDETKIVVKKNVLFNGFFFKEGDKLKLEDVSKSDIKEMINLLSSYMLNKPEEIIYYDLDENNIKKYNDKLFFKTCNSSF